MTKKKLIELKKEWQEVAQKYSDLKEEAWHDKSLSLTEKNIMEIQASALNTVQNCIETRIILARGHENGKHD